MDLYASRKKKVLTEEGQSLSFFSIVQTTLTGGGQSVLLLPKTWPSRRQTWAVSNWRSLR